MPRKKRRGPKKKRGPKKPRYIKKGRFILTKFPYQVIACKNGVKKEYYGKFFKLEKAYAKVNELLEATKNVEFPQTMRNRGTLHPVVYEFVILERNDDGTKPNPSFRNEYGKLIEHKTTSKTWIILDKFQYQVEEQFWLISTGQYKRYTFRYIYENYIVDKLETQFDFLQIQVYANKILIKEDNGDMEIVMCKNSTDAIRFYNLIETNLKKDKIKQVIMLGVVRPRTAHAGKIVDEIMKVTGLKRNQVERTSTRH